jgi:hypothetical protein
LQQLLRFIASGRWMYLGEAGSGEKRACKESKD